MLSWLDIDIDFSNIVVPGQHVYAFAVHFHLSTHSYQLFMVHPQEQRDMYKFWNFVWHLNLPPPPPPPPHTHTHTHTPPLAACREPAGKLWQLCRVSYVCDDNEINQGWGLLKLRSLISPLWKFSILQKHILDYSNHIHIWQVSPQPSCGDTCQI